MGRPRGGSRNGTFTCCINKTRIQDGDNNFRVDQFPFACQVRGAAICCKRKRNLTDLDPIGGWVSGWNVCVLCFFDTLSPVLSVGVRGQGPQKWLKYYKCWLSDSNVLKICCNDLTVDVFCESNALNFADQMSQKNGANVVGTVIFGGKVPPNFQCGISSYGDSRKKVERRKRRWPMLFLCERHML